MKSEGWALAPNKTGAKTLHYFIRNGRENLCGHHKIPSYSRVDFVDITCTEHKICQACSKNLEYWKQNHKRKTPVVVEPLDAAYYRRIAENQKMMEVQTGGIVWVTAKCDEKGCNFTGSYPTTNTEEAKHHRHFCPKHNLRIQQTLKKEMEVAS